MSTTPENDHVHAVALVSGYVQGVGFRFWTFHRAKQLDLSGSAVNLFDGRVKIHAEGPLSQVTRLLDDLRSEAAPGRVTDVEIRWKAPTGKIGFRVG